MSTVTAARTGPPASTTPWTRFCALYAVLFLMGAEMFLASPLLPSISADLHASTTSAARMVTAYVIVYAVSGPPLGRFADRAPRRVFVAGGTAAMAAGVAFCAAATGVPLLIAGQAIAGFGGALAAPAMWAYLAEHAAPGRRGRATGLGVTCYALGQVLGVPAASATTQFASWRWAYAGLGACLLAALPVVMTRLTGARPAGDGEPHALFRAWRLANARRALLATGAMQAGRLGAYTYVGVLYTQRFHFTPGRLAAMGLVVGAGTLAGSLAAGVLNDHWRARGHTEPALSGAWALLFALAAPVALTADRLEISLVALFVWFVAGGAFYATQQAYLGSADPHHRATLISWNNTLMNVGIALGTTVLGMAAVGGAIFAAATCGLGVVAAGSSYASAIAVKRPARG